MVKSVTIDPPLGNNDHCSISVSMNFHTKLKPAYTRTMWNFEDANFVTYRNALDNINWDNILTGNDINNMCVNFTNTLLNVCKDTIPNKTVTVRPSSKPFYNVYLRRLRRKVNRLHNQAKLNNSTDSWSRFRHERNHYTNEVHRCKLDYDKHKFEKLNSNNINPKTYYKMVKNCLNQSGNSAIPPIEGVIQYCS